MDTVDRPKTTVLTAGGAGVTRKTNAVSPTSSSTRKEQRHPTVGTTVASSSSSSSENKTIPQQAQNTPQASAVTPSLEYEEDEGTFSQSHANAQAPYEDNPHHPHETRSHHSLHTVDHQNEEEDPLTPGGQPLSVMPNEPSTTTTTSSKSHELIWLLVCFLGIMASFVCYGLLLEYATSGGREFDELSFLFVTSALYTLTAAAGRYVRDETPSTIPPARFAILGLTSMCSTYFSVRSLRYVIYPIQVLAKSCKPVPVMLMGAVMGKSYPLSKYINVCLIVAGVALFMGGGTKKKSHDADHDDDDDAMSYSSQIIGIIFLFISLCFDGGTGAYEDKLMSVYSVEPFDLMYNIQLGKTILAGIGLLVQNQLHVFKDMVAKMGFLLIALGLSGALGQVFIFVTIAKFGALTCSIIGLARKVTTLCASIYFYGHHLNAIQGTGLLISITAMVLNFWGKKKGGGRGHGHHGGPPPPSRDIIAPEELEKMLNEDDPESYHDDQGQLEMQPLSTGKSHASNAH